MKTNCLVAALMVAIVYFVATAQVQTNHFVTLTWKWDQGIGDPATGFHIQRSATTGGPYTIVGTVPLASLEFTDNTVAGGKTYFYVVTGFNSAGDSVLSNEVSCPIPFLPPANPTGLQGVPK